MKFTLNFSIFLFSLFMFDDKLFSLTNYQIINICKNEKRELDCIKDLQDKRSNLRKGNLIEIPVIPYKR